MAEAEAGSSVEEECIPAAVEEAIRRSVAAAAAAAEGGRIAVVEIAAGTAEAVGRSCRSGSLVIARS